MKAKASGISDFSTRIVDLKIKLNGWNQDLAFYAKGYQWKVGSLGAWVELLIPEMVALSAGVNLKQFDSMEPAEVGKKDDLVL